VLPSDYLKQWRTVLHFPLPLAVVALVSIGAVVSPVIHIDRLFITYLLILFGLIMVAYPLDALFSDWKFRIKSISSNQLIGLAVIGTLGYSVTAAYAIYHTSLTGIIVAIFIGFFLISYNSEHPKWIHNKWGFAISWGGLPIIASYYYQSLQINWIMIPLFISGFLLAMQEWYTTNTKSVIQQKLNHLAVDEMRKTIRKETFRSTTLMCYTQFAFAITLLAWRII
jgi:hypothetical protein